MEMKVEMKAWQGFKHSIVAEIGQKRNILLEEYVKLHIQPKPKWLPQWLWHKILKRLLVMELR